MIDLCDQRDCPNEAAFLYTWPGKDQKSACCTHAKAIKRVADAMGMHLQMIPILDLETRLLDLEKPPPIP